MSDEHLIEKPDDVVECAIGALRNASIPDGPRAEALDAMLKTIQTQQLRTQTQTKSKLMMKHVMRGAIAAGVIAAVGMFIRLGSGRSGGIVLADVLQAVEHAKSLHYRVETLYFTPGESPAGKVVQSVDVLIDDTGRERSLEGDEIRIFDPGRKKLVTFVPDKKQAKVIEGAQEVEIHWSWDASGQKQFTIKKLGPQSPDNILENWKKLPGDARPVGQELLGGRTVDRFEITANGNTTRVWVDVQTRLPARTEFEWPAHPDELPGKNVFSDIQWNVPINESLMSLEPPPGYYTLVTKANEVPAGNELSPNGKVVKMGEATISGPGSITLDAGVPASRPTTAP